MLIVQVPPYNTCATAEGVVEITINGASNIRRVTCGLRVHHRLVKLVGLQLELALELRQLLHRLHLRFF